MNYFAQSNWGPNATPKAIKYLLGVTAILSLGSALLQDIFNQFSLFPGPQMLLGISWWGIGNGYLWQPLTYFFIQDTALSGLSLSFVIYLCLSLYLLWVMGTQLYEHVGRGPFLRFYFTTGIGAGIITLLLLGIFRQHSMLMGTTPVLLALLTTWGMAFGDSNIFLFFLIPLKGRTLASGIIVLIALMALFEGASAYLILYIAAIAIAYIYATTAWGWRSPFPHTEKIDDKLIAFGTKIRQQMPAWMRLGRSEEKRKGDKVVDMRTGEPMDDDAVFVEKMLEKISKYGEGALSYGERRRLDAISQKKSR